MEVSIAGNKIFLDGSGSLITYKRMVGEEVKAQASIISGMDQVIIGVFPIPPLFTPKNVAKNMYLKFRNPIIVDQQSEAIIYAKMPIEIGVYRQSEDEELMIDAFSPSPQRYALYGSPESGVVCRYADSDAGIKEHVVPEKYSEALVSIKIVNEIDNVVKVNRVIIPMDGIILDHAHDDSWLPGNVEMLLDSAFGKDIVKVHIVDAKVKRLDKTSNTKREETRTFMMDAGY